MRWHDQHTAQIGGLGRVVGQAAGGLNVGGMPQGRPAITTRLPDAKRGGEWPDNLTSREAVRSMMTLPRTPNGGFMLRPG